MSEAPNTNQTSGLGETFSSQSAPQTNPFTADLKGEFTSNFGTNTGAVSQIFKEGGFVNQNKTRYIIYGVLAVVIIVAAGFLFMPMGEEEQLFPPATAPITSESVLPSSDGEVAEDDGVVAAEDEELLEDPDAAVEEEMLAEEGEYGEEAVAETPAETAPAAQTQATSQVATKAATQAPVTGSVALMSPSNGAGVQYDETRGPAVFTWEGSASHIVFSRDAQMARTVLRVPVSGNSYSFHHPWPGNWYWRVENSEGASEIRSFSVAGPTRRNLQVMEPASGGAIAGTGGVVAWQGDSAVALYRVEFSQGSFSTPSHRFATSGNSVQLQGVPAGQYQMRVGAFSEVSGRWEYNTPTQVTVQ